MSKKCENGKMLKTVPKMRPIVKFRLLLYLISYYIIRNLRNVDFEFPQGRRPNYKRQKPNFWHDFSQ